MKDPADISHPDDPSDNAHHDDSPHDSSDPADSDYEPPTSSDSELDESSDSNREGKGKSSFDICEDASGEDFPGGPEEWSLPEDGSQPASQAPSVLSHGGDGARNFFGRSPATCTAFLPDGKISLFKDGVVVAKCNHEHKHGKYICYNMRFLGTPSGTDKMSLMFIYV